MPTPKSIFWTVFNCLSMHLTLTNSAIVCRNMPCSSQSRKIPPTLSQVSNYSQFYSVDCLDNPYSMTLFKAAGWGWTLGQVDWPRRHLWRHDEVMCEKVLETREQLKLQHQQKTNNKQKPKLPKQPQIIESLCPDPSLFLQSLLGAKLSRCRQFAY